MNHKELEQILKEKFNSETQYNYYIKDKNVLNEIIISDYWTVGGLTGGNCFGGSADFSVEAEPEEEFTQLDDFIEEYFPDTTFSKYRKIMSMIKFNEESHYEYYGNYTVYRWKYISFRDLIEILCPE